jgi:hypothetical protein
MARTKARQNEREEERERRRPDSPDQNEREFRIFTALCNSEVAPVANDERPEREHKKGGIKIDSVPVNRTRRETRGGRHLHPFQEPIRLANRDCADGEHQPDPGTTKDTPPTELSLPNGKTQKIQRRKIKHPSRRSLADAEFDKLRVACCRPEIQAAEPSRND